MSAEHSAGLQKTVVSSPIPQSSFPAALPTCCKQVISPVLKKEKRFPLCTPSMTLLSFSSHAIFGGGHSTSSPIKVIEKMIILLKISSVKVLKHFTLCISYSASSKKLHFLFAKLSLWLPAGVTWILCGSFSFRLLHLPGLLCLHLAYFWDSQLLPSFLNIVI